MSPSTFQFRISSVKMVVKTLLPFLVICSQFSGGGEEHFRYFLPLANLAAQTEFSQWEKVCSG